MDAGVAAGDASAEAAAARARLALETFHTTGSARALGAAQSAIAAWDSVPHPPPAIWLLRGRLAQTQHRFADAARDLSLFNSDHPGVAEALLLEADAWRRAGEVSRARTACLRLALAGRVDLARYCTAEVLLTVGQPAAALALLAPVIDGSAALAEDERNWALAVYADVLIDSGDPDGAAAMLARILASERVSLPYMVAYADVLLSLSRHEEVLELLSGHAQATTALLRLAVAASRLGTENAESMRSTLQRRMAHHNHPAGPHSHAHSHLREQALYAWWLKGDAEQSLRLALRNWELQKGWEDAALVLTIARTLNRTDVVGRIRDWQQSQSWKYAA